MPSAVLSSSLEDYMEALYREIEENRVARVKNIAKRLKVRNSSVTGALRALALKKLVNYAPYEVVTLTAAGENLARKVVRRHQVLKRFFINVLNVDEKQANKAACEIEHAITPEIADRLSMFVEFIKDCPRGGEKWINGFAHYCQSEQENCEMCIATCLEDFKDKKKQDIMKRSDMNDLANAPTLDQCGGAGSWRIVRLDGSAEARRRFLAMGATRGTVLEIVKVAPLGDPIEVKLKGYHLSLRKEEAAKIQVEPVVAAEEPIKGE